MKTLLLLFSLSFSLFSLAANSEVESWAQTSLDFNFAAIFINQPNCHKDSLNFAACTRAINAVGTQLTPAVELVATSSLTADQKVLQNYGALSLVEKKAKKFDVDGLSRSEIMKKVRQESQHEVEKLKMLSQQGAFFHQIFDDFYRKTQQREDRAYLAALANNVFVTTLDAHGSVRSTATFNKDVAGSREAIFGIGAAFVKKNEKIVLSPLMDSPAEKGGLKKGDILTHINGVAVDSIEDFDQVVSLIKGPRGSTVQLTVQRRDHPQQVSIVRDQIQGKVVQSRILTSAKKPVGYIRLDDFMYDHGCSEIINTITEFRKEHVEGLILDLRGNPGGLITQGVCLGGVFVGKKLIVTTKSLDGKTVEKMSSEQVKVTEDSLVVLIDANSASASELLSGALQDHKRAWILGERSFGKGSVQTANTRSPNYMIFRTTALFYQPSGRTNQGVGIIPDFTIPLFPEATEEERFVARELDLYSNALQVVQPEWKNPRKKQIAKIEKCMNEKGQASSRYAQGDLDAVLDYQVLKAIDVLNCD